MAAAFDRVAEQQVDTFHLSDAAREAEFHTAVAAAAQRSNAGAKHSRVEIGPRCTGDASDTEFVIIVAVVVLFALIALLALVVFFALARELDDPASRFGPMKTRTAFNLRAAAFRIVFAIGVEENRYLGDPQIFSSRNEWEHPAVKPEPEAPGALFAVGGV